MWGAPAFLIVAGVVSLEPVREWPILKFLGDASFSVYLVHGPALWLAARVLAILYISARPVFFLICLAVGIGAGAVCYLLIEKPLLRLFRPSKRKRIPLATADLGAATPIGVLEH